ncbi:hypothetical protein RND81_03G201900 [Saponaria officinalis]|uniref:RNA uridylyltransferase n=1 Tax=Saponaria officinalis TaxID=3572 RepID=A0AAW1M8P2_SAPOF
MTGGGGSSTDPPPSSSPLDDGEFLLRLLQNRHHQQQQQQQRQHHPQQQQHQTYHFNPNYYSPSPPKQPPQPTNNLSFDPAVSAVGPSLSPPSQNPNFFPQQQGSSSSSSFLFPQNTLSSPPWPHHLSPSYQTPPFHSAPHHHFRQQQQQPPLSDVIFGSLPFSHSTSSTNSSHAHHNSVAMKDSNLERNFDLFKERDLGFDLGSSLRNGFDPNRRIDPPLNWALTHGSPTESRRSGPPPGFSGNNSNRMRSPGDLYNVGREMSSSSGFSSELGSNFRGFSGSNGKDNVNVNVNERRFSRQDNAVGVGGELSRQIDHPGLPAGSAHRSVLGSDVEQSLTVLHGGRVDDGVGPDEVDELSEQLVDSVLDDEPSDEKNELSAKKKHPRDKDFRADARGKWILPQRTRNSKKMIECRRDIHRLSTPFLAIYKSLIPPEEEKLKQKQLMALLEKLVCKEWPNAKLYLYGSCANSFGVLKSDIDVCLAIDNREMDKSEILLKLADILQSDNLQNVQALTRARVPIVKLKDPVTGISCDICINNVLAVVNTKLLRDYAEIDVRLRQLAFLVKHWAKSRGINETYQGTLSSYAYVLMCIHFLQQRYPPILPCLQGMKATYAVTVDHIECSFFDQVEQLRNFGAQNKENIAQLMWAFFSYWAYCHDYANTVISVRTGNTLSKHEKDWTRRVGNDRHLICIEDPFEVTHDLGRVVDKHSIRVLREEFERAAWIMQYDPNPCASLFEPYLPAP